jgi:hypothetical protein
MKTRFEKFAAPTSEHLNAVFIGRPKSAGVHRKRTIAELLDEAEERGGVYGSENKSVDSDMTVSDLLDWHCNFLWEEDLPRG